MIGENEIMQIDKLIQIAAIGTRQADRVGQEGVLLIRAGTAGLQARAGWIPLHDPDPMPDPAPIESVRYLPPAILKILLDSDTFNYVWRYRLDALFTLIREMNAVIPPEYVLAVLQGLTWRDAQTLFSVFEGRGRWLIDCTNHPLENLKNPSTAILDRCLQTEDKRGLEVFQRLRERDPAAAREWLQHNYLRLDQDWLDSVFGALKTHLSVDDEPFLTSVIYKRVRNIVVKNLKVIPHSAYHNRMIQRAQNCIVYTQGQLKFLPIQAVDQMWEMDGFYLDDPAMIHRWYTYQVFQTLPPTYWGEQWGISDAEVIKLNRSSIGQSFFMFTALTEATILHQATDFARQLCYVNPPVVYEPLFLKCLPNEERETYLMQITQERGSVFGLANALFKNINPVWPWSTTFSAFMLEQLPTLWLSGELRVFDDWADRVSLSLHGDKLLNWQEQLNPISIKGGWSYRLLQKRIDQHQTLHAYQQGIS